ncbi:hypothetical protein [Glutamicibacter arilaitensis]|uniref:hypothetical protein n=1 Tax=Glutamicibacter arilaitensis TaxID=256701 RepID=UPI003F8ED40D
MTEEELAAQAAAEREAAEKAAAEEAEKAEVAAKSALAELPDWAAKEIESLRREAASNRVSNKALTEKLAATGATDAEKLKALEEVQAANAKLVLDLAKQQAIAKHGLPDIATALLTGNSEAEIAAAAEALALVIPTKQPEPQVIRPGDLKSRRNTLVDHNGKSGADLMRDLISKR